MALTRKLYKHKDNVGARLLSGVSASTLSLPLQSGHGAQLPTTATGTATSLGTSTTLNCTGIAAALAAAGFAAGDIIENVTDGSYGVIKSISTNAVVTTRLKGGSGNIWANTNKWCINRFVVTLIKYDVDGTTVLQREKALIDSRSGDILTVNATGRGFDGSSAASFASGDYVYMFMTSAAMDGVNQGMAQLIKDVDNLISQGHGEVYAADTVGTDAYAITLVPAITAYAVGQVFNFKAGTPNMGPATLAVNGLTAITIRKNNDQTLDNNDIEAGQIVTVVYDGTYFQMQSQVANLFSSIVGIQNGQYIYAADSVGSDSYAITLSPAPTAYAIGQIFYFKAGTLNTGPASLNINALGARTIKKAYNSDLQTGDILANQIVQVVYDGTNFQMMSPSAAAGLRVKVLVTTHDMSVIGLQTISGVGFQPKLVQIKASYQGTGYSNGGSAVMSQGDYDGTTQGCTYPATNTANPEIAGSDYASGTICLLNRNSVSSNVNASAVASNLGADGFDLTWSKSGFPTGTIGLVITCFG